MSQELVTAKSIQRVLDFHGRADFLHGLLSQHTALARSLVDDFAHQLRFGCELGAACADRIKKFGEGFDQSFFYFYVANGPLAVTILQVLDFCLIGVEHVVIGEDRIALDVAGITRMDSGRVGEH